MQEENNQCPACAEYRLILARVTKKPMRISAYQYTQIIAYPENWLTFANFQELLTKN